MPKIEEYCEIIAAGQKYRNWETVEVSRDFSEVVSNITLSVAEISPQGGKDWSSVRLKPGDPMTAYLAGKLVATGHVIVRQAAYNKDNHSVRFIAQSLVADLIDTTVEAKPGQYRKSNLKQIAGSVLKPFGIDFSISGSPDGADKIFDRVSVQPGESPFQLIERLCRMRNLHLIDDAQGNLTASRRDSVEIVGDLQEGRNILSAELVWNEKYEFNRIKTLIDEHGTDQKWADEVCGISATATNPNLRRYKPLHILAEQPGDAQDAVMRTDNEVSVNTAQAFSCSVTVRGWLRDDGSLWIEHVGKNVNVYSPMLFPMDKLTLAIQGVTHKQNDKQGTTTTINLTTSALLNTGNPIQTTPAKPDQTDT